MLDCQYYSLEDIVRLYVGAKNKIQQIQILADLTDSDTETIIEVLKDAGVLNDKEKTVCCHCGQEYPRIYRKGKSNLCPVCRDKNKKIAELEYRIKVNSQKINSLSRKNQKYRSDIEKLRGIREEEKE